MSAERGKIFVKSENLNITKYTISIDDNDIYYIFIIPEIDHNNSESMNFYIQKQDYGLISSLEGLTPKDFNEIENMDEYIDKSLSEWIKVCEYDIEKAEKE